MLYRKLRQNLLHRRRPLLAMVALLLATVAGLWSWNTLAELFSWPPAEYRHALAAVAILYVVRWILFPAHRTPVKPTEVKNECTAH